MKSTPIAHIQPPEGMQGEPPQGRHSERPTNAGKAGPGVPAAGKRKDRNRLAAVAELPCCICTEYGMAQASPTQVHHCIHGRYSTAKAPDSMTIPLCEGHHQGLFDTSKLAIHRAKETWRETYGADTEWISWTEERL